MHGTRLYHKPALLQENGRAVSPTPGSQVRSFALDYSPLFKKTQLISVILSERSISLSRIKRQEMFVPLRMPGMRDFFRMQEGVCSSILQRGSAAWSERARAGASLPVALHLHPYQPRFREQSVTNDPSPCSLSGR